MSEAASVPSGERRKKRVLVLWYSQSGQLRRAAAGMVAPLEEAGLDVSWEKLVPEPDYPFPWSLGSFLSVFPDTVTGQPCRLAQPTVDPDERFDLVILAYTVWYLSPSLPFQSLFATPLARVLRDTPVVTFIACRNMWFTAEGAMRQLVAEAGGRHVGTVAVTDDGPAWASFVTTPRWLLTGKKGSWLRIFPPAGISDETIGSLRPFGEAIVSRWDQVAAGGPEPVFDGLSTMSVDRPMVLPDLLIGRLFRPMGRLLGTVRRQGQVRGAIGLAAFGVWLTASVVTVVVLLAVAQIVLHRGASRLVDRHLGRLGADTAS